MAAKWSYYGSVAWFTAVFFGIVGVKLLLSLGPTRRWPAPNPSMRLGVIVTVYNEDPALLRRCIDSILTQTYQPTRILIVDDCSTNLDAYDIARVYATFDPRITVVRQPVNLGKREGLAVGFHTMDDVDVYLCLDSDSFLEPNAIYEGMRPFRSKRVTAVTGLVLPLNYDKSILTRFQDILYVNSFLNDRTATSRFQSVLCVCGAIAFYRRDVMIKYLDDFLSQTFLGKPALNGEDRRLTNYCLREGRVVFVDSAIAHTAVPEKFNHFIRQQARWGRSFFRESLWLLTHRSPARAAWWFTFIDVAQWAVYSTFLLVVAVIHPITTGGGLLIGPYLMFIGLMSAARAIRYFDMRRFDQSIWSRLTTAAVAPLYGYFHLAVMFPVRLYSFATMSVGKWGSRQQVEVSLAPLPETEPEPAAA